MASNGSKRPASDEFKPSKLDKKKAKKQSKHPNPQVVRGRQPDPDFTDSVSHNKALRLILGVPRNTAIDAVENELRLPPLNVRFSTLTAHFVAKAFFKPICF